MTIDQDLLKAARALARFALDAYSDGDDQGLRLRACVSAGMAVELALKAAVAFVLPTLLAERGDIQTQLYLAGLQTSGAGTPNEYRTIGALEAARVLSQVRPDITIHVDDVKTVLRSRNLAAHLAIVDDAVLEDAMRSMVVCLQAVLPSFEVGADVFWGEDLARHASVLGQAARDKRLMEVEQLLSAARRRLGMLRALGETAFQATAAALEFTTGGELPRIEHCEILECPVCGFAGRLAGSVQREALRFDHHAEAAIVDRMFFAFDFECRVCGLYLVVEEFPLVGIPESIAIEPDYEPEELHDYYAELQNDWEFDRRRRPSAPSSDD